MRVASIKRVYFSSSQMKEAIIDYIRCRYGVHAKYLIDHLRNNEYDIASLDGKEFVIHIAGELEDGPMIR